MVLLRIQHSRRYPKTVAWRNRVTFRTRLLGWSHISPQTTANRRITIPAKALPRLGQRAVQGYGIGCEVGWDSHVRSIHRFSATSLAPLSAGPAYEYIFFNML